MVCVDCVGISDADTEQLGVLAREFKALSAPAGQCEIEIIGLQRSLYFLHGWSEEVINGSL